MTGLELRRFAVRRVTVHASPPRRAAYCVPHLDGTSRGGSKARATPGFHVTATQLKAILQPILGPEGSSPSNGRPDQNNTNLLPGNRLGSPIDVTISEDCDDWISARHRMIGKKDHRLAARRNLDRAANHALAGQLLPLLRDVVLQRLTLKAHPDPVAATGSCPWGRSKRAQVVEPVISRAAQRVQDKRLARQRRRRGLVNVGEVGWWRPDRQDVAATDQFGSQAGQGVGCPRP